MKPDQISMDIVLLPSLRASQINLRALACGSRHPCFRRRANDLVSGCGVLVFSQAVIVTRIIWPSLGTRFLGHWFSLFLAPKLMSESRAMAGDCRAFPVLRLFFFWISSLLSISLAYKPGDIVPMSRQGQYHGVITRTEFSFYLDPFLIHFDLMYFGKSQSRTVWQDAIGRHCPIFAVNREVRSLALF